MQLKCGAQYTSKFEGMITDTNLAADNERSFQDWMRTEGKQVGLDFSVQVLTTGFWPR
jgi:cullin 1